MFNHPPVMDRIEVARSYPPGRAEGVVGVVAASNSGRFLMPSRVRHFE